MKLNPLSAFLLFALLSQVECTSQNRTIMEDHPHTNALINETSPYLLQHAHNPVNWYPWGEEALQKAQKEGKLIIVSIGYSSCHWCHVMAHESFEDSVVAALMNEHFISIKIDREERPDIDNIYMTAVQLLNQRGGWPLNCIALPDGKPLWGGTYFPKEQWMDALKQVAAYYREQPEKARQYASELAEGIRQNSIYQVETDIRPLDHKDIHRIVKIWSHQFDLMHGGSKGAPKFPMPVNLEFLLHYGFQYGDNQILDYVDLTLTKMARGGIYDQAGGGFARYSTDQVWKVPHFEKMLYDNAQLIGLYARAYQVFGKDTYRNVVRQSVDFLRNEMVSGEGAFFSALDADSDGEEGKYYVWKKDELEQILEGDFDLFSEYYNINETGLWEDGNYILYRTTDPRSFAEEHGLEYHVLQTKINKWNKTLLTARAARVTPGLDDKSLTSWSALTISGLVQAYRSFGDPDDLDLAITSAALIRDKLLTEEGLLYRNYKEGQRSIPAFHIDYALFIEACLDLYEVSLEQDWLDLAIRLTGNTISKFFDEGTGMFNYSSDDSEILITNSMETRDNVIPASNSVMAHNLFRLGHIMTNRDYLEKSLTMIKQMADRFQQYPQSYANWGRLLLKQNNPYFEVAVVGPSAAAIIGSLSQEYLPHAILTGTSEESILPLFANRYTSDKTRIFVCQDNVCQLPVEETDDAKAIYHIQ